MNAPRVFQRYIYDIFRSIIIQGKILIYMDKMIATKGINEHLAVLRKVVEKA